MVQFYPLEHNESNTSAGTEMGLEVNEPNGIPTGKAQSAVKGPVLKEGGMGAEASESGQAPRVHPDSQRLSKAVGVKNLFTRA